jgi:rSAM/selenodomain-associated transferase 2
MISIIIPTFNEATQLSATLSSLNGSKEPYEVVVVDARSTDGTAAIAKECGARVITNDVRQRAAQMNAGARLAQGQILLFLHADTRLAPGSLDKIASALREFAVVGGGFARRYESPSSVLRLTCLLAELRTRCFGWFLGDQAIFVCHEVFDHLGGFCEWDIFEDLDFSRRLARTGRTVTLRPPVISAARRFDALGAARTTWNDLCLTVRYLRSSRAPGDYSPRDKSDPCSVAMTR